MAKYAVVAFTVTLWGSALGAGLQNLDENGNPLPQLPGEIPQPEEIEDPVVRDLLTANDLPKNVSFRCGMFYSPNKVGAKPKAKIFILPKRFKIENATFEEFKDAKGLYSGNTCDDGIEDGKPQFEMEKYCFGLFKKFVENNNMKSGSKVRDPVKHSMGDDFCEYLTKVGVPKDKVPPNKKFPKGIQVGFYYNKCNDKKWYDTTLRMEETVCCKLDGDTLKYNAC